MKKQVRFIINAACAAFCLLIFSALMSCGDDDVTGTSGVTVRGTLNLPFAAAGKTWAILIDNDMDGGNGYVKLGMGTCGAGTEISYTVGDVPKGMYYIYAVVFIVGDYEQGPQMGDLLGIYGGQIPDDMPTSPNASVGSGTQTFDIDLFVILVEL